MKTVKLSELPPGSYLNLDGEIVTKERVEQLIDTGYRPTLFTVSDQHIDAALKALQRDRLAGREPEDYCEPDPYAMRVLY